MKVIAIVKYTFTIIGVGMFVGAILIYQSVGSFLAEATKTEGTVVRLDQSRSNDSTIYSPVVQFTNKDGQAIEFVSSTGSNPPSHSEGEKVEILYHPKNPQNAKINDFFSLWGGSIILGSMGGVFFLIGFGIILAGIFKNKKNDYLKKNGTPIETEYQGVELNTALSVNGRHPFQILTQWENPSTSEIHVFTSDNIWFDPTSYIKTKTIRVFIENGKPKKYYVDLSFLPKLAK
jgi:hypothetical protein